MKILNSGGWYIFTLLINCCVVIHSPGNHGRFSRMLNTAISSSIMSEQSAGPTTQDILSVGILIIPRDLPVSILNEVVSVVTFLI